VRLLIVDDHADSADSLAVALRVGGHHGEVALNGEAAVTRFASAEAGHFDALVIDLYLPGMSGVDCLARLRAMPGGANLPAVLLTGAVGAVLEDAEQHMPAGPCRVVQKPCDPPCLLAVIESLRGDSAKGG
jgi:CheY-like chemotaxis protein